MWSLLRYADRRPRDRTVIVVAAVAQTAAIVFLPIFETGSWTPTVRPPTEMIEIVFPIGAFSGGDETSDGRAVILPTAEELEVQLGESGDAEEEEAGIDEAIASLGLGATSAPFGVRPEVAGASVSNVQMLRAAKVLLEEVVVVTPEVAQFSTAVDFPQIRNPSIMKRFLRSRYNPLFQDPGETGTVNVAVWINERGTVESASVWESSGYASLDAIAVSLFQEIASFYPARQGRRAVPVQVTIAVPFQVPW